VSLSSLWYANDRPRNCLFNVPIPLYHYYRWIFIIVYAIVVTARRFSFTTKDSEPFVFAGDLTRSQKDCNRLCQMITTTHSSRNPDTFHHKTLCIQYRAPRLHILGPASYDHQTLFRILVPVRIPWHRLKIRLIRASAEDNIIRTARTSSESLWCHPGAIIGRPVGTTNEFLSPAVLL